MPPKAFDVTSVITRLLDRYGLPVAFLAVVLFALNMVYRDMQAQNARMLAAFVQQSEAALKMAASVETLARAVEARR